jgi:mycothiol synthase
MSRLSVGRLGRGLLRRAERLVHPASASLAQLEMLWPEQRFGDVPRPELPAGFVLRNYRSGDESAFFQLLERASMGRCPLDYWMQHLLPHGFFLVEQKSSGTVVATCFASHQPTDRHPFGGNLGWLAADPDYSGRGLGYAVTAAVTGRLVSAGYRRIYLTTDDFRLPAINIYLKMGWVPLVFEQKMMERWKAVCEVLGRPFHYVNEMTDGRR